MAGREGKERIVPASAADEKSLVIVSRSSLNREVVSMRYGMSLTPAMSPIGIVEYISFAGVQARP